MATPMEYTLTENKAKSLATTGSARVNLFFKTVRGITPEALDTLLVASWAESGLDTLRLIFQARDCRGGKGEKALFHRALLWLSAHHPAVLEKNLTLVPEYGSWKDPLCLVGSAHEAQALELYAAQLKKDKALLEEAKKAEKAPALSLCAKWAPSERHESDTKTHAAKKLAKLLCGASAVPMKTYRKQYLVPLRASLRITETLMCDNRWAEVRYSGVPSRCMNKNKKAFTKHDEARFTQFLEDVKAGRAQIKAKQLFPHELVTQYMSGAQLDDVLELQWKVIVEDARKAGAMGNSLVVSDVSGSMSGIPMQVSIALGLLLSELLPPPFTGLVITFHEDPTFHLVKGASLHDRVADIARMSWGGSTNFQKVFDIILAKAVQHNLPQDKMPSRVFVLSDMQFNVAGGKGWNTNHEALVKKYAKAGYKVPELVYWNLRANTPDFPVASDTPGVALVSGFSPSILKVLMETGELNPYSVMRVAIDAPRYSALQL